MKRPFDDQQSSDSAPSKEDREPALQEGVDFYIENGLFVFTAEFLRRRGYCCESGCRHCPYEKEE